MAWTSTGSILLTSDWQYTQPIAVGLFFRLKHTEAPNGGLFVIAQCEIDADGKLSLIDSQVMAVEQGITDVIKFSNAGCFSERRIAIKKLPKQPSLQQEIKRLFLPGYLQPTDEEIRIVSRSRWAVEIEVSDFVELVTAIDITPLNIKLDAISTKLDNLQQPSSTNPSSSNTDEYFNNVVLLMHMDGVNGSTTFTDVKSKAISLSGNAQISTTQSKLGGSSGYFDGSGDYLSLATSSDFNLNNSYTIEFWAYLKSRTNYPHLIQIGSAITNRVSIYLANSRLQIYSEASNGFTNTDSGFIPFADQWYHIALTISANTLTLFVNGIEIISSTHTTKPSGDLGVAIGTQNFSPATGDYFNGYIDELRITRIARYTSNFTPTNTPFPNN